MLNITIYLTLNKKSKKDLWFSQLAKGISVNYIVMDTSNIVLWVSVCVRNMNAKDFALTALLSYTKSL